MSVPSDPLIDKLVQRLADSDPVVRLNAVGALRLHGKRAIPAIDQLAKLTIDKDDKVRAEVNRTLARLRQAAA